MSYSLKISAGNLFLIDDRSIGFHFTNRPYIKNNKKSASF